MASVTVKHETTYQVPPEAVFAAITDVEREPEWQPQVLRVWREPDGPVTLGTRIGRERKIMGKATVQLSEVVTLEPNVAFGMREQQDGEQEPFRVRYQLSPAGPDATRLEFELEIEGVPAMFVKPVKRRLGGEVSTQFDRLADLLAA